MRSKVHFKQTVWWVVLAFIVYSCGPAQKISKPLVASIEQEGFIDCYEPTLKTPKGKDFWSETSAVLVDGNRVFLGNDHQMPDGRPSLFSVSFDYTNKGANFGEYAYESHPLFRIASKYEEFAITPDGNTVFLMTGFDRVHDSGSSKWDGFNSLLYWKAGKVKNPKVVSVNGKDSTSISIRPYLAKVLRNNAFPEAMPYFKTEGLTVYKNQLLFGVRELGKNYDEFDYAAKIISVTYRQTGSEVYLEEDYRIFSDMDPNLLAPQIKEALALSSIEYHPQKDIFFLLTSFEDDDNNLGAYLWWSTYQDLASHKMFPVQSENGQPLRFDHKAEDLSFIDENTLLIIHDDDKESTKVEGKVRQSHQAVYSIVKLR